MAGCGLWNVWMSRWNAAASQARWSSCSTSLPAAHPLRNQHISHYFLKLQRCGYSVTACKSRMCKPSESWCRHSLEVAGVMRVEFPLVSHHTSPMEAVNLGWKLLLSLFLIDYRSDSFPRWSQFEGELPGCVMPGVTLPWMRRRGGGANDYFLGLGGADRLLLFWIVADDWQLLLLLLQKWFWGPSNDSFRLTDSFWYLLPGVLSNISTFRSSWCSCDLLPCTSEVNNGPTVAPSVAASWYFPLSQHSHGNLGRLWSPPSWSLLIFNVLNKRSSVPSPVRPVLQAPH